MKLAPDRKLCVSDQKRTPEQPMPLPEREPYSPTFTRPLVFILVWVLACAGALPAAGYSHLIRSAHGSASPAKIRVLVITGGHEFDAAGFTGMFQKMDGISCATVSFGQGAEQKLNPQ